MSLSRLQRITGEDRTLATRSSMLFLQKLGTLKEMIEQENQPSDLAKIRAYFLRLSSDLVLFEKEPLIQLLSSFLDIQQHQNEHPVPIEKKEGVCREIKTCMNEVSEKLQEKYD